MLYAIFDQKVEMTTMEKPFDLRDFIRDLVAIIKRLEAEVNSFEMALYTFKKSYPEHTQMIDDLVVRIRREPVPPDPGRERFDAALERLLQLVPESPVDSEFSKAIQELLAHTKNLVN